MHVRQKRVKIQLEYFATIVDACMRPVMEMYAHLTTAIAVRINMPKYDYKCESCSSVVEITRSFDEDSSPMCTACNTTMTRQWNVTAAIFRGGGWGGK